MNWNFVERDVIDALHAEQLKRHGGLPGLRDENALNSALDRPKNKVMYEEPDVFQLAAAYLYGLSKNHPYSDGNKRIAIIAAAVFVQDNGYALTATDAQLYQFVLSVAAGEIDETGAAMFFKDFCVAVDPL
jgi:death on curing protein